MNRELTHNPCTPAHSSARDLLHRAIRDLAVLHGDKQRLLGPRGNVLRWLVDLRRVFMRAELLSAAARLFWETCGDRMPFQVGGVEAGAVPLVAAILVESHKRGTPITGFVVRKERKTYGHGGLIDGEITDAPIIVVDDLVNSARSLEKVRVVIEHFGKAISCVVVILDLEGRGGAAWRARREIPLISVFKRGDFGFDYRPRETQQPPAPFRNVWHFAAPDPNFFHRVPKSFPITDDRHVYFGSDCGTLWCLNATTGGVVWTFKVTTAGHKNIWSAPALHRGHIYFGGYDGNVYCLDAVTGRELWRFGEAEWVGSSPAVAANLGLLFIGLEFAVPDKRGSVVALTLDTGRKVWEHITRKTVHGSPAYWSDQRVTACGSNDDEVLLLDGATGCLRWQFRTRPENGAKGAVRHAPAFDAKRGHIIAGCADGNIYVIDTETGNQIWRVSTGNSIYTVPLVHGDLAFVGSTDKHMYVLDLARQIVLKKIFAGSKIYGPPRLLAGNIYFGACNGVIYEVNPVSLDVTATHQLVDAVTNSVTYSSETGFFYALTYTNELFAFARADA